MILTQDIVKGGGSIFSGKNLVTHSDDCNRTETIDKRNFTTRGDFFEKRFPIDYRPRWDMDGRVKSALSTATLYGILDLGYVDRSALRQRAQELCDAGVDVVQLRAKGHAPEEIHDMAESVQAIVKNAGIPFIINDFPEIAVALGSDGVHIGQDDGSLASVRAIVGEKMLVGRSTHSVEQARAALAEGFDYIGFGPLFPTPTKVGRPGIGMENIAVVEREVGAKIPVFCIGGIHLKNLPLVKSAGARRVVIVSALWQAPDLAAAVRQVKAVMANP